MSQTITSNPSQTRPETQVEAHLHALKSPDPIVRRQAFDAVMSLDIVPLSVAWAKTRALSPVHGGQLDCMRRTEIVAEPIVLDRAIVTVISKGYEHHLAYLLRSLERVGNTVPVVVFCEGDTYDVLEESKGIIRMRCYSRERLDPSIKGAVYSCARWVKARHIIALEVDMVVLESLEPLWSMLENLRPGTMAGARPQVFEERPLLRLVLGEERGEETQLPWLKDELFLFNGGLLAGDTLAWGQLDALISGLGAYASIALDGLMATPYMDEIIMNWAANQMAHVELHPSWNAQFYTKVRDTWITVLVEQGRKRYECRGAPAKILHFVSKSRLGAGNLYDVFLRELGYLPTPRTASLGPNSSYTRCKSCGKTKSCQSCFEPSTYEAQRLPDGMRTALCRDCFADQNNLPKEDIPLDIRMELEAE